MTNANTTKATTKATRQWVVDAIWDKAPEGWRLLWSKGFPSETLATKYMIEASRREDRGVYFQARTRMGRGYKKMFRYQVTDKFWGELEP